MSPDFYTGVVVGATIGGCVIAVAVLAAGRVRTVSRLIDQALKSADDPVDAHAATAVAALTPDALGWSVGPQREHCPITAAEEDAFTAIAGECPELGGAV